MGSEGLKLVSKMALKKWNSNFRFQQSVRKNRTTFSGVPLLREIFRWNDPKSRVPFTFQPDFPETFCKLWTNPFFHANQCEKNMHIENCFVNQHGCLLVAKQESKGSLCSFDYWLLIVTAVYHTAEHMNGFLSLKGLKYIYIYIYIFASIEFQK